MINAVYTIGHSTHAIEKFFELLKSSNIEVVSDVRSRPYSRMNPQFNRELLKKALGEAGIRYVFLGKELGARSEDRTCYINGQVQYDLLAQTELFKSGISRVKEGAERFRIALMCAEKEPLDCHRTILVARQLAEQGTIVKHILANGELEDYEHSVDRLIAKFHIPQNDMFLSRETAASEAFMRQGKEIGYREEQSQVSSSLWEENQQRTGS